MPFSCFALPHSFSAVPRASGPVFMFCASGLIFGGTEGVGSRFHVLRSHTRFRRYRGRRVPFSCFARPDSFSAILRASAPVFMFCALGHVFGCNEGVASRFHVLRPHNRFRRYRRRLVPFSCFALPDLFSAVPRALGPVFMFCVPVLVFGGTEGVGSRFHVLRFRTLFRRYRERQVPFSYIAFRRRVPFSCFALPDSFSAVPRASGPVFMYCLPESFPEVSRASGLVFMFCALILIFGGTKGVGSRFHVLRVRTHFQR
jgi:hypothetical protein